MSDQIVDREARPASTTRRQFLVKAGKAAAAVVAVGVLPAGGALATQKLLEPLTNPLPNPLPHNTPKPVSQESVNPTPKPIELTPTVTPQPIETPQPPKPVLAPYKEQALPSPDSPFGKDHLNYLLGLPLGSPDRKKAETDLVSKVSNLKEIDAAFWVVTDMNLRAALLNKRYQLRLQRRDGLEPLPQPIFEWAVKQEIHPEVLAICREAYPKAKELIGKLFKANPQAFRPDIQYLIDQKSLPTNALTNANFENFLINAGGMAKLICTETGIGTSLLVNLIGERRLVSSGFANIGDSPAYLNFNPPNKPGENRNSIEYYQQLTQIASEMTGLDIDPKNAPGSRARKSGDANGGAVSVQIMPDNLLRIEEAVYKLTGQHLNWLDPVDSTILAWIILAEGWLIPVTDNGKPGQGIRTGYLRGSYKHPKDGHDVKASMREEALAKWNPERSQITAISNAAESYFKTVNQEHYFAY